MKIGILGFQGAVIEHQRHIEQLGAGSCRCPLYGTIGRDRWYYFTRRGEYYHGKITKQDRNDGTAP